jgi:hypothetical protein
MDFGEFKMINIVCLKWGTKYGPEYVNRLYAGVKRNTSVPFKFWCFTEDSTGIDSEVCVAPLPFSGQLETWWNKLYLFSDKIPIPKGETIFYIDLDTLIVDNIDHILKRNYTRLVILKDFFYGIAKSANAYGSGLMMWTHGTYNSVWQKFIESSEQHIKAAGSYGDQWWIEQQIKKVFFWQDIFPGWIVSFKVHCRNGLPKNAKIICYHGRPSIPESASETSNVNRWVIAPQPWVLGHWRTGMNQVEVRYVTLPANEIFGMVGRCGGGYNTLWADWSEDGRRKRDLIMQEFEKELDNICGHYSKLEQSILSEGIKDPVIVTCGLPKKRSIKHLPPEMLDRPVQDLLLLEGTTGGSRLYIAQKYNMNIQCIVNDWTGRFKDHPKLGSAEQVKSLFNNPPAVVNIDNKMGLTVSFDDSRTSYHLDDQWSEEKIMPLRAPMWIKIMNKYGYSVDRLSPQVNEILKQSGVVQPKSK